jgi:hypothetical protein
VKIHGIEEFMANQDDPKEQNRRKPYEKPTLTQLTPEEAKLKLIDLVSRGDEQAKEMLVMILPDEAEKLSQRKKKSA